MKSLTFFYSTFLMNVRIERNSANHLSSIFQFFKSYALVLYMYLYLKHLLLVQTFYGSGLHLKAKFNYNTNMYLK